MFYVFPDRTYAVASRAYERPYENPVAARQGEIVRPVTDGSMETDFIGWTWCIGADGRAGWTPDSWCEIATEGLRLVRDFSALEHTVRKGDRLRLMFSESGFIFCESESGERAWIPDAVVELEKAIAL